MAKYVNIEDIREEREKAISVYENANILKVKYIREGLKPLLDGIIDYATENVVEVVHGEWLRQNGGFFFLCSVCGKAAATKGNFCHNCGAKMHGKGGKK